MIVVLFDVETTTVAAETWGVRKQYLSHEAVTRDWSIICASWKLLGQRSVHSVAVKPSRPTRAARYAL